MWWSQGHSEVATYSSSHRPMSWMRLQVHVAYNAANEGEVVAMEILDLWVEKGEVAMENREVYRIYDDVSETRIVV